jgi:hypothetical protein
VTSAAFPQGWRGGVEQSARKVVWRLESSTDFDNAAWPLLIFEFGPTPTCFARLSLSDSFNRYLLCPAAFGGAVSTLRIRSFAFAFLQRAPERVGLGPGLDDVGAVGDAVAPY